jgi:tetratricopeptide (TPR) repeat protein
MDQNPTSSSLNLPQQAINAALNCLWDEALKINKEIIKSEPNNIDALSRLGRASFELGKIEQAKKYYQMALKIDPYNPIAIKNLKILKVSKSDGIKQNNQTRVNPGMFLHEPGKTKVVNLLKVAEPQKLSQLYPGMGVILTQRNRNISVTDLESQYLGVLPDDVSFSLIKLIKGGNKYQAIVKSVRVNGLSILIKESFRAAKFKNRPSFPEVISLSNHVSHPTAMLEPVEIIEDEE